MCEQRTSFAPIFRLPCPRRIALLASVVAEHLGWSEQDEELADSPSRFPPPCLWLALAAALSLKWPPHPSDSHPRPGIGGPAGPDSDPVCVCSTAASNGVRPLRAACLMSAVVLLQHSTRHATGDACPSCPQPCPSGWLRSSCWCGGLGLAHLVPSPGSAQFIRVLRHCSAKSPFVAPFACSQCSQPHPLTTSPST